MSEWRPLAVKHNYGRTWPSVGDVVAYNRSAWEVMHVSAADPDEREADRIAAYRPAYREQMSPYRVTLRRIHGAPDEHENSRNEIGLRVRAGSFSFDTYPNGRVPLCSCHGEPWPCLEADQQAQAEHEMKAVEREMRLMPGCCPACEEPVTSRQKSITFGGPNVRNPLAEGPTFHLRRECRHAAAKYEELWVNDEPGRERSLLTLSCAGMLVVHGDGSAECFGAVDSDCPSVYARHRGASACYLQTHGCPRGCSRHGHPGAFVPGRPTDPRAVTR